MNQDDFVAFLRTFIHDRLSGMPTKVFMDQYKEEMGNLTLFESETMVFHDFVIVTYPDIIKAAFEDNDSRVLSIMRLMGDAWMMRADMQRKMCTKANCGEARTIISNIISNN